MKGMFNHICKCHNAELITNTTKEVLDDMVAKKKPFFVANTENQSIYGCMGCYKAFTTFNRAQNHLHTSKECMTPHLYRMSQLSKNPMQIMGSAEENTAWFKTLCHFLSCFDRNLVELMETFNCYTNTIESSIRLLEEIQEKIIKCEDIEWRPLFSNIVKKIDKVNRECGGDVMGFMKFTTRCKWLPTSKQLYKIMTPADVEFAKNYKLKSKAFLKEFTAPVVTLEEPED
jgi:hypothetical protein